jgi:hypothetical protein
MAALREHGAGDDAAGTPATAPTRSVCMHAAGDDRGGQTTGSMVSELRADGAVHWVTGTAAPCLSLFKPAFLDLPLPDHGPAPRDRDDPASLWWRHERLHRGALRRDFAAVLARIAPERDRLEAEFRAAIAGVRDADAAARARVVAACWATADAAEARWTAELPAPHRGAPPADYAAVWGRFDDLAAFSPG